MPTTTIAYLIVLASSMVGSFFYHPFVGMIAYVVIYNIGPVKKWWGEIPYHYGIRDSQFMYLTVILSYFLKPVKTNVQLTVLDRQEWLLILYLALLWFSTLIGPDLGQDYYNVIKVTKVILILIFASHIITHIKLLEIFWWALIICNIYMGYNAIFASDWMFINNRLDIGIGSVDFGESNFLAAHMVMLLPITGVVLIKSSYIGKIFCMVNIGLSFNTLALLRSRGALIAMIVSLFLALIFAEKKYRLLILAGAMLGIIGFTMLTDEHYWSRMTTIVAEEQERDSSAQGRLVLWEIAWKIAMEYPLGVGVDNYKPLMGDYGSGRAYRDTHSTYFKCLAEAGFIGIVVLGLLIYNSLKMLTQIRKLPSDNEQNNTFRLYAFGLILGIISYLTAGTFISMNYIEEFYWVLMMPLFLKRAIITATIQKQ